MSGPGLSEVHLAAIRERADAATPGPWTGRPQEADEFWFGEGYYSICNDAGDEIGPVGRSRAADAAFIAHARADIPALLDEVARLRAALRDAKEVTP